MMNRKQQELEGRVDDMLSRIAMETQEIKELEQQLTNGQILANEFLQRDLKEIISGLQEYLGGLRDQASRAQQKADILESEKRTLQRQLQDMQTHCRLLESTISSHRQDASGQRSELSVLWRENQVLRERQVVSRQHQLDLESQLLLNKQDLERITAQQQAEKLSLQQCVQNLQAQVDQSNQSRDHCNQSCCDVHNIEAQLEKLVNKLSTHSCHGELLDNVLLRVSDLATTIRQQHSQQLIGHLSCHSQQEEEELREDLKRVRTKLKKSQNALRHVQNSMVSLRSADLHRGPELNHLKEELQRREEEINHLKEELQCREEELNHLKEELQHREEELIHLGAELRHQGAELEQNSKRLQEVQEDRDTLLEQLCLECGDQQLRIVGNLQELMRVMFQNEQLTAKHILNATQQLSELHTAIDHIDTHEQQYLCSPEGRGRCRVTPPMGGGYWVYMPPLQPHTAPGGSRGGRGEGGAAPSSPAPDRGLSPGPAESQAPLSAPEENTPLCSDMQTDRCCCYLGERDREERKKREDTQSSQCVCVLGELVCVEVTLLKRRAELRQTDRLLLDAQTCLLETTHKASEAKQMLICTQTEVEEMERRAEHSATCLLEAKQHIRRLQEELRELRRRREESEPCGGGSGSGHHSYFEGST